MVHNLSKIFMDYGDSNWTVGVLIGFLIFIAGIILFAIGICNKGKLNIKNTINTDRKSTRLNSSHT